MSVPPKPVASEPVAPTAPGADVIHGGGPETHSVWPEAAVGARLHFVSGKGGTGKTTVAAALALAMAGNGKKVLLVECEGRQGLAQLFDTPPLPPTETRLATADGGGEVVALAIDIEHALLEYLEMFYNLGFAGRAMRRIGAIDFVTTVAPGLRDVLLTGKIKECVVRTAHGKPVYDAVVVDAPPTGRIGNFLDVTTAMRDLTKTGPIRNQSDGVASLLHSPQTAVHLVTLLEAMPIQETVDAIADLRAKGLPVGALIVNRVTPQHLADEQVDPVAEGIVDAESLTAHLAEVGVGVSDADLHGLLTETVDHANRVQAQHVAKSQLDEVDVATVEVPAYDDGVDLGGVYDISGVLRQAGVR